MTYKVRKATSDELEQLKEFLQEQNGDEEIAESLVKSHYFVVLEGYISDCPGYSGKLLVAVFGMPEFYQLYGWDGGKLVEIKQDNGD